MRNSSNVSRPKGLSLILLLLCFNPVRGQNSEFTTENYCQLTKSLMELSALEWRDRVKTAIDQKQSSSKEMVKSLEKLTSQYRKPQNRAYRQYGIGKRFYLRYGSDHKTEIESYLEDNQDVRGEIESIREQINGLIQQFESVMSNRKEGEQQ